MNRASLVVAALVPLLLGGAPGGESQSVMPAVLGGTPDVNLETLDTSGWPQKYQDGYKVFAVRCSKCHPLSRANGHLSPDGWRNYVKRMSRTAGSGINPSNGAVLVDFLIFYTQLQDNPPDGGMP